MNQQSNDIQDIQFLVDALNAVKIEICVTRDRTAYDADSSYHAYQADLEKRIYQQGYHIVRNIERLRDNAINNLTGERIEPGYEAWKKITKELPELTKSYKGVITQRQTNSSYLRLPENLWDVYTNSAKNRLFHYPSGLSLNSEEQQQINWAWQESEVRNVRAFRDAKPCTECGESVCLCNANPEAFFRMPPEEEK